MPLRGSTGIAKKLGRTQRSTAITILGVLHTSPLNSLEVHAFLLPAPLLIQDTLYRSALQIARLPQAHPLHPKLKWIESHDIKRHCSALHNLIHILKIKPSKIETSIPLALHPSSTPLFSKSIAPLDKEAIEDYKKNRDVTKIFMGGSSTNGKVGASAILYVNNTQVASLQYHLGVASEHTVFEAELVGMTLAAHLLATINELPTPTSIFIDNQAAILAGERPTSKPGHCYDRFSSPVGTENRGGSEVGEILTAAHREFGGCVHRCVGKPKRRDQDRASPRRRGRARSGTAEG